MKLIHYINTALLLCVVNLFWSCDEDESNLSKAVLTSASALNFGANGAAEQVITVYADAEWVMEKLPEWVKVTPQNGTGTMDVTIVVTDNIRDGAIDNPRKATIVFRGTTLASRSPVIINQDGDKYRDCQEYSVDQLPDLADETAVSVSDALVTAVTGSGCIISDTQYVENILLQTTTDINVGDKISIKGSKMTDSRKLAYLVCDEVEITSSGNVVNRPSARDITSEVDTYTSGSRDWISVVGTLDGTTVTIEGATNKVSIIDAPTSLELDELNGHRVKVNGYFDGLAVPMFRITAATVEDLGVEEVIYFSEDFEWLSPWSVNSCAGQTVENDGDGSAPQIYSAKDINGVTAAEALIQRGYGLEQTPGNAIYLQQNYLKFGKTDYQAGLTLPSIEGVPENATVQLSFDWAPMVGGTRKFDPVQLIIYITNDGRVTELDPIGHKFVDTVDHISWLHVDIRLDGITITKNTRITIKSDAWGENKVTAGSNVYRRWFIDNIKVTRVE